MPLNPIFKVPSDQWIIWCNQYNSTSSHAKTFTQFPRASNANCFWLQQCKLMKCFCFARGRQCKLCTTTLPYSRPDVPSSSVNNLVHQKQPKNNGEKLCVTQGASFWSGGYTLSSGSRSACYWHLCVGGNPEIYDGTPQKRIWNTGIITVTSSLP